MEFSLLYPYLETYKSPAIFLGAFLFGETIILSAVFLAIENSWSLLLMFVLSFLGTLIADIVWFVAGGYFLHNF